MYVHLLILVLLLLRLLWLVLLLLLLLLLLWSTILLLRCWCILMIWWWLLSLMGRFWCWCWIFNYNISWCTYNFSFKSFFWISSISYCSNETIRIYNWVTALNDITIFCFFTILVICKFIIFNIKSKLIRLRFLKKNNKIYKNL